MQKRVQQGNQERKESEIIRWMKCLKERWLMLSLFSFCIFSHFREILYFLQQQFIKHNIGCYNFFPE